MHLFRYLIGISFTGLFLASCNRTPVEIHPITQNWLFKHADSVDWLPASVPGSAHLDLLENGLIEDPFYEDNELNLQWIGESDWEYKATFFGDHLLERANVELIFDGLDTYATVYLNDSLILNADNMFRYWEVDIKKFLNENENTLIIHFSAPGKKEEIKAAELDYKLPELRGFTRKAPYQYGWDWGPRFITTGIWKPVYIRAWDDARITEAGLIQNSLSEKEADYTASIDILSTRDQSATLEVFINKQEPACELVDLQLTPGLNIVLVDLKIESPRLWWPSGIGDQPLYTFDFKLKTSDSRDEKSLRTGLRKIELVQEKDSIGETFYFKVNGLPVFMKGANYIPQDNFLSRVPDEKYKRTIQAALDANMNMLRVWGGGIYEDNIFYDLCDEKGLLIWQDFIFACNMYPGDTAFLENVKQEAEQQVKRLDHHPSVVLWCGNNEVDEGWHNWGWQRSLGYTVEDSLEVWNNYLKIFHEILPNAVAAYSPRLPYVSSSPRIGWGHKEALLEGDMHYWGVWWGEEPFTVYEQKVGRFMSEFGFQGFPDLKTLDAVIRADKRHLGSEAMKNHQKHPRGMEIIRTYMGRDFPVPGEFEHFAYISQLLQAYGVTTALEAHRRAKPQCMGTLYWQLNDCWPVISWSSVDYENRWKALHYDVRRIYSDYLISIDEQGGNLDIYIISDKYVTTAAMLELTLMDFNGHIKWNDTVPVSIPANSSSIFLTRGFEGIDKTGTLLFATLGNGQENLCEAVHYFATPRELILPEALIDMQISELEDGVRITLASSVLAKNVYLQYEDPGFFSDNYFDLLPNIPREIYFHPDSSGPILKSGFLITQLSDISRK